MRPRSIVHEDSLECFGGKMGEYHIFKNSNKLSTTKSGLTCQRWDTEVPHKPKFCLSNFNLKNPSNKIVSSSHWISVNVINYTSTVFLC